jgi:hypothetical protein
VWIDLVVEALVSAATAGIVGTPINIGSGKGTPLLSLAGRILELVPPANVRGGQENRLDVRPARSVEVTRFVANVDRMCRLLDLQPPDDPLFGLPLMLEGPEPIASLGNQVSP